MTTFSRKILYCTVVLTLFQINGRDATRSSREEVVEAFKNAENPIVVQVCRRLNLSSSSKIRRENRQSDMSLITTSTQTDPITEDDDDDDINDECTALLQQQQKQQQQHCNKLLSNKDDDIIFSPPK